MAKCPYCERNVTLTPHTPDSLHKEVVGLLKKEVMYACPHCERVLGFTFFFGGLATGRP